MKKIKTLLSVATIGLLSTSIAPIASCSSSQITITNESVGVTLIDLPISMSKNIDLECKYRIDDPAYIIDETKSDILVSGSSIKAKDKVEYLNNRIFIPKEYVNGNITIKLITKKDTTIYRFVNESDSDVTIYDNPTQVNRGVAVNFKYSVGSLTKKIDFENSTIKVGVKEYPATLFIVYGEDAITIPAEYVDGDVVVILKTMEVIYNVTNLSSSNVAFNNLPKTIQPGETLDTQYTIPDGYIIDAKTSDILNGNDSIKYAPGVLFEDDKLQIDKTQISDDLTIKLISREKVDIDVKSVAENVTITDLPTKIKEKTEITGTYTIPENYELDIQNCDIVANGISVKTYPGVEWSNGNIKIPSYLVKQEVTITLKAKLVRVIDQTWAQIVTACNKYETDKDETAFLSSFTINGTAPTSLDELIGAVKDVTFYSDENAKAQRVRIIGYNHDDIWDGSKVSGKAVLTFELANLFSDPDGDYLKTLYQNDDLPDPSSSYSESQLITTLNNENDEDVEWMPGSGESTDVNRSCIWYLNKNEPELAAGIKTSVQNLMKFDKTNKVFVTTDQQAKLFPLSYTGIGLEVKLDTPALQEGTAYKYYVDSMPAIRLKTDVNGNANNYWLSTPWINKNPITGEILANQTWFIQQTGEVTRTGPRQYLGITFTFCI